ncbi:MAG: hypothetical protein ACOX47_02970 [Bacillota bacterium]
MTRISFLSYHELCKALGRNIEPIFGPDRPRDIKHSNAGGMSRSGVFSGELKRRLGGGIGWKTEVIS